MIQAEKDLGQVDIVAAAEKVKEQYDELFRKAALEDLVLQRASSMGKSIASSAYFDYLLKLACKKNLPEDRSSSLFKSLMKRI